MTPALDALCALARHTSGARAVHVLDASATVLSCAGPGDGLDRGTAIRAMAAGRVERSGRVLYHPVPGGLLAATGRRAPRPEALTPFVPLAELLLAAAAEPARLARDLHDSVVQTLYGISLGAGTAAELLYGNPAHAEASLAWIKETAAAGLTDLRGIILRLRPETLVGAGLATALKGVFETLHAASGLTDSSPDGRPAGWGLQLDADPPVSPQVEEALYRIALEALGNAARHAAASQVTLRLAGDDSHVVLEVIDDGVGFAPDGPHPGRLGLRSMRERAALLGGTLDIHSAPGAGTVVRAALPTG
ncbi:sensor histidine kinase [Dactylosporangium sp. CA-092794]|uniref:sensor histidine kinase n=1 Tax=Dactylosporangium sp. CA-092794 TaxID=3239929 RepID=UPI003D93165D